MSEALAQLFAVLRPRCAGGVALGFSGGTDSSLLLAVLVRLRREHPFPLAAFTMTSAFQFPGEAEMIRQSGIAIGVEPEFFPFDPFVVEEVRFNRKERCYFCKKQLFCRFAARAEELKLETLMDGTNGDDLQVYRPGRKALAELGVFSPLAECRFRKTEIRRLAAELGLACASRPAMPCLATRFEYDTELTPELLGKVAAGESFLRELLPSESDLRLRVHGKNTARIEVSPGDFPQLLVCREQIVSRLRACGFQHVSLDLAGFRSGSMDPMQGRVDGK